MRVDDVEHFLNKYKRFDDCALLGVEWRDHGHTFDLLFNSIYGSDGIVRDNLTEVEVNVLRFGLVQEAHFMNGLNAVQIQHPGDIEWSVNIISGIELVIESDLLPKYQTLPTVFRHVRIYWESPQRRIDLVFSGLEYFQRNLGLQRK